MSKRILRYQSIFEYVVVFVFVTLTSFVLFSIFVFDYQPTENQSTFAGAMMRLHDEIVSVVSAPLP